MSRSGTPTATARTARTPSRRGIWSPGPRWVRLDAETVEILDVNDALLDLFAATSDQVIGRLLFEFTYPENAELLARQRDLVARGEVLHSLGRARTLDGRDIVLEYVCHRVRGAVECRYRLASVAGAGSARA